MKRMFLVKCDVVCANYSKVKGSYLIDAMTFTEAEARVIAFLEGKRVEVTGMSRQMIDEVIGASQVDEDVWYRVVVGYKIDNKLKKLIYMVRSSSTSGAEKKTRELIGYDGYNIVSINETKIAEVVIYELDAETYETM